MFRCEANHHVRFKLKPPSVRIAAFLFTIRGSDLSLACVNHLLESFGILLWAIVALEMD